MKHAALLAAALLTATAAQAHDGHGLSGAHWHATDTVGFVAVAVFAAAVAWLIRRK